jgi:hypothetical protein
MCHLTHDLKIRNGLIVLKQQHPDETTPLVNRQELRCIQGWCDLFIHLDGTCIERNRFLVSKGLAGLVS